MDRTKDFITAAERFLEKASLPPEQTRRLREALILGRRSKSPEGSFAVAARGVEESIRTLWGSIRNIQQEYSREPGSLALPDPAKDSNEAQVAAFIGQIGGYIDRLKQAASSAHATGFGGARANEQTVAHMHGVVLILAERLHRATLVFDRLRAARYQALVDGRPPGSKAGGPGGAAAAGSSRGAQAGGVNGGNGGGLGWQHILGLHISGPKGHGEEGMEGAAGASSSSARGPSARGGSPEWPTQTVAMEVENKALLERLTATRNAAFSVEQAVRDVAALNQMFSSAVLAQAETIEGIYLAAVEATHNISAGNVSLSKTVAVNRSTTRYIVVLLLVATLCLLFFDWFNS